MGEFKYYNCGICGHLHPWNWNGDCRDNDNRFTQDEVSEQVDLNEGVATWEERLAADRYVRTAARHQVKRLGHNDRKTS